MTESVLSKLGVLNTVAFVVRKLPPLRGRGVIAQQLCKYKPFRTGWWSIDMDNGSRMRVPRSSEQGWKAAFTGFYEEQEVTLIAGLIEEDSFFLDAGACFGFYTVPLGLAAKRLAKPAYGVAFEPVHANALVLKQNVLENNLDGTVAVFENGLGDREEELTIGVEPGGAGNAIVINEEIDKLGWNQARTTIKINRLDDIVLPEHLADRTCSLMKFDVEGYEILALRGGTEFIKKHRPVIFGEFNVFFLPKFHCPGNAVQLWAEENNYTCLEFDFHRNAVWSEQQQITLRTITPQSSRNHQSLLLVPNEKLNKYQSRLPLV